LLPLLFFVFYTLFDWCFLILSFQPISQNSHYPQFQLTLYTLFACIPPHDTKFLQTHRIFIACNKNPPFYMECFHYLQKIPEIHRDFLNPIYKFHLLLPTFPISAVFYQETNSTTTALKAVGL